MLKSFVVFALFSQLAFSQKLTMDERRKQILGIVDQELSEVSRLAKQENFGSPDTLLRISELNLEKARLWRETENEQYLSIPPEQRRDVTKSDYFKKSAQYFDAANDAAEVVVKRFPKYKGIGEVYYILAYNHKELGHADLAHKYFLLSSGKSGAKSDIKLKSNIAIADFNFNAHKYKEAIPYYESALGKIDEKWWTKDSFNLAWCYYRTQQYEKAINLMREVHKKSSNKKYIDLRSQVERDIGIFYVDSGKIKDAVKFYESLGINYTEQFVKIASSITTQGRFSQAESLLEQAAKFEKDRDRKITIYLAQLDLFDKYNKIDEHLTACQSLIKMHQQKAIGGDELKKLVYHVNKKAAELQKVIASDIYKQVPKVRKQKSEQAIVYFELSSQLNPGQKAEKTFFQGETAYAAGDYKQALTLYVTAFDEAKKNKESKLINQSLEGMLSSLGQSSLDKKVAEQFYVPVYSRYLSHDHKSERANSIFVKLFNSQFDNGDVAAAEKTMADFAASFPEDYKTQEGMLAKVMEHYRSKKDYSKVKSYVGDINTGKFKVSTKYAEALRSLMTKIQIEGVQQSLEKGDKDVALKGYLQIYESTESTPKAKINAAYNLSALYYEMGNSQQSYLWGVTAVKDMEADDVVKFSDSYLSIAAGLFLKQHFEQSADLSYRVLAKICKHNSSNKNVSYKNAVFIALANGDLDKAIEIKEFGKSCLIPDATITEVTLELIKDLIKSKKWEQAEGQITELEKNAKNYPYLIKPFEELRKVYINLGDLNRAKEIEEKQNLFFNQSRTQKLDIPVDALDLMASKMMAVLSDRKQKLDQIELKFPESEFNSAVKAKLQLLDQMTNQVTVIQKLGSGRGIVDAYKFVIEAYEVFGESLKNFTPDGKSPEYIASFQKAMSDVYIPILNNARKQRSEIRKLVLDNKILSRSNFSVLFSTQENYKRYLTSKPVILMERGGKR
jgi:hypothetical protein